MFARTPYKSPQAAAEERRRRRRQESDLTPVGRRVRSTSDELATPGNGDATPTRPQSSSNSSSSSSSQRRDDDAAVRANRLSAEVDALVSRQREMVSSLRDMEAESEERDSRAQKQLRDAQRGQARLTGRISEVNGRVAEALAVERHLQAQLEEQEDDDDGSFGDSTLLAAFSLLSTTQLSADKKQSKLGALWLQTLQTELRGKPQRTWPEEEDLVALSTFAPTMSLRRAICQETFVGVTSAPRDDNAAVLLLEIPDVSEALTRSSQEPTASRAALAESELRRAATTGLKDDDVTTTATLRALYGGIFDAIEAGAGEVIVARDGLCWGVFTGAGDANSAAAATAALRCVGDGVVQGAAAALGVRVKAALAAGDVALSEIRLGSESRVVLPAFNEAEAVLSEARCGEARMSRDLARRLLRLGWPRDRFEESRNQTIGLVLKGEQPQHGGVRAGLFDVIHRCGRDLPDAVRVALRRCVPGPAVYLGGASRKHFDGTFLCLRLQITLLRVDSRHTSPELDSLNRVVDGKGVLLEIDLDDFDSLAKEQRSAVTVELCFEAVCKAAACASALIAEFPEMNLSLTSGPGVFCALGAGNRRSHALVSPVLDQARKHEGPLVVDKETLSRLKKQRGAVYAVVALPTTSGASSSRGDACARAALLLRPGSPVYARDNHWVFTPAADGGRLVPAEEGLYRLSSSPAAVVRKEEQRSDLSEAAWRLTWRARARNNDEVVREEEAAAAYDGPSMPPGAFAAVFGEEAVALRARSSGVPARAAALLAMWRSMPENPRRFELVPATLRAAIRLKLNKLSAPQSLVLGWLAVAAAGQLETVLSALQKTIGVLPDFWRVVRELEQLGLVRVSVDSFSLDPLIADVVYSGCDRTAMHRALRDELRGDLKLFARHAHCLDDDSATLVSQLRRPVTLPPHSRCWPECRGLASVERTSRIAARVLQAASKFLAALDNGGR